MVEFGKQYPLDGAFDYARGENSTTTYIYFINKSPRSLTVKFGKQYPLDGAFNSARGL